MTVATSTRTWASSLYWPFVSGMSCYDGGYAMSGDSMDELKAQFYGNIESVIGISEANFHDTILRLISEE